MKNLTALIAALVITVLLGLGIVAIGINAFVNHNTVALQSSPNAAAISPSGGTSADLANSSAEVQQLQQQVNDAQTQLSQAQAEIQQYQSLISELEQRGVIRIDQNGTVFIPRQFERDRN